MKSVKIYGRSTCHSCRSAVEFFEGRGVEVETHDLTTERLPRDILEKAIDDAHVDDAFEHRSPFYHLFGLDKAVPPKKKAVKILVAEPGLLRVPLVLQNGRSVFGWDREGFEQTFDV